MFKIEHNASHPVKTTLNRWEYCSYANLPPCRPAQAEPGGRHPLRTGQRAGVRHATSSAKDLQKLAPQASLPTLELALTAYACASASQGGDNGLLTVIDYSRPSRDKRLWVFDLKARKLLFEEWVTHGKNSGDDLATSFSNRPNSYQSSIGLFQTGQLYTGKHGQSLRLVGLEPGFNDKSEERAIVMHSAAYADPRVVPGSAAWAAARAALRYARPWPPG